MLSRRDVLGLVSSWMNQISQCETLESLFEQIDMIPQEEPSRKALLEQLKITTENFIQTTMLPSPEKCRKLCCTHWGFNLVPKPVLVYVFQFVGQMADLISCIGVNRSFRDTITAKKNSCFSPGTIEFTIPLYRFNAVQITASRTNRITAEGVLREDAADSSLPRCLDILRGLPNVGVSVSKSSAYVNPTEQMNSFIKSAKILQVQDGVGIDSVRSDAVESMYLHIGYDEYRGHTNISVDYPVLFPNLKEITLEFRQFMENKRLPELFPRHLVKRINIWNLHCCSDLFQKLLETDEFPNLTSLGLDFEYSFGKKTRCSIPPVKTLHIINPAYFNGLNTWMASYSVTKVILTLLVTGYTYDPTNDWEKLIEITQRFSQLKELVVIMDIRGTYRDYSASSSRSRSDSSELKFDLCDEDRELIPPSPALVQGQSNLLDDACLFCDANPHLKRIRFMCDRRFAIGDDLWELFGGVWQSNSECVVTRDAFVQSREWERAKFLRE